MIASSLGTFSNIDLLAVGAAASAIGLLGFVAIINNRSSATVRAFFFFAVMTILWNISNFLQYQFGTESATLGALRIDLFIATVHSFSFFHLCYVFPREKLVYPSWYGVVLVPAVATVSSLTLTPLVVEGIKHLAPRGEVTEALFGPGMLLFTVATMGMLAAGITILFLRLRKTQDRTLGLQIRNVAIGMTVTATLIVGFSLVLPVVFRHLTFLPFSAAFFLPFIGFVSYSIYRLQLFNFKIVAVQALTYVLGLLTFTEIIFTDNPVQLLFRAAVLCGVIAAGVMLTRSVTKEIEQRELIEKQEKELEVVNKQQENLLHFISHEIKGYLTKSEAGFASIVEGDYGTISEQLAGMAKAALADVRKGVRTVMEILDASNLKKGTVGYKKSSFDLKAAVIDLVEHLKPAADEKHIGIKIKIDATGNFMMSGDEEKIRQHVLRNLIDNAIKYTPSGNIKIALTDGSKLRFSVQDSGIGITPEDMKLLFTEGGHGKDSIKVNVHSTGYGLFIAKQIVEAHKGKIWAESEGEGKGATFIIEFPTL
jgi:signal transduction histidine kinase